MLIILKIYIRINYLDNIWVGLAVYTSPCSFSPFGLLEVFRFPTCTLYICQLQYNTILFLRIDEQPNSRTWGTCEHCTFIAQIGGIHEDLSHPENSCCPRAKPEGNMNFLGGTNLCVSRLTRQLFVYYTESCSTTLYNAERCAVRHNRETRRLEGNTTILFSLHVTSLDQSYFLFVISIIWGIIQCNM